MISLLMQRSKVLMPFRDDQETFIAYSWMLRIDDKKIGTQDTYGQWILVLLEQKKVTR